MTPATCFEGADIITRVTLPFGLPPASPTVWVWDELSGDFIVSANPNISAELVTTAPFDAATTSTFETLTVQVPNSVIGNFAEDVPGQAIAQIESFPFFDGDVLANELAGECSVPFRLTRTSYPVCLVLPDPVAQGDSVSVSASGLFENDTVEVLLGDLLVGEGSTDNDGKASVQFDIPLDTPPGQRLVTVGVKGTSLTADCAVEVTPADPELMEQQLLGVVFDTGEFVRIDPVTGEGKQVGSSEAHHGLTHRGTQLYGIDADRLLFELNPATGATLSTRVPGFGDGAEGAIAFRRDGVGFAIRGDAGDPVQLWRFGAIDGGAVLLAPNLGARMDAMAFHPDDRLFGLSELGVLFVIDTEAGFIEAVGSLDIALNTTAGMAFDPGGRLYAVVSDSLYTINTITAKATLVGATGFGADSPGKGYSGLASVLVATDADNDAVPDVQDNCLGVFNPDQIDANDDGIGNMCDADLTGDCFVDFQDLARIKEVFFSNNAEADLNNSGSVEFGDLSLMKQMFFAAPGPSGDPNACETRSGTTTAASK